MPSRSPWACSARHLPPRQQGLPPPFLNHQRHGRLSPTGVGRCSYFCKKNLLRLKGVGTYGFSQRDQSRGIVIVIDGCLVIILCLRISRIPKEFEYVSSFVTIFQLTVLVVAPPAQVEIVLFLIALWGVQFEKIKTGLLFKFYFNLAKRWYTKCYQCLQGIRFEKIFPGK